MKLEPKYPPFIDTLVTGMVSPNPNFLNLIWVRTHTEITVLFGNFSPKGGPPPPIPPFWEPLIQKKNYRLFCILDP